MASTGQVKQDGGITKASSARSPASGLSRNILNMKFMRDADYKEKESKEEEIQKQIDDESKWTLSSNRNIDQGEVFNNIGYSDIHGDSTVVGTIKGRRSLGVQLSQDSVNHDSEEENENDTKDSKKDSEKELKKKSKKKTSKDAENFLLTTSKQLEKSVD